MSDEAPPLDYDEFRSGLTFAAIRAELRAEQDAAYDRGEYMAVTRATVLGRWRQRKLEAWEYYQQHQREQNMKFLVNPDQGASTMAKRKTSAATRRKLSSAAKNRKRRADGSFAKGGGGSSRKRKKNPPKKRARAASSRRRAPVKRKATAKRRRSNPRRAPRNFTDTMIEGVVGTVTLTGSKVATRYVPGLLGFSRTGNKGLATQVATAVALGWLTDFTMGPGWAAWVLAGGLQAPLEDGIQRYNIPVVSEALAPAGTMGRYAPRLGRYAPRRTAPTPRRAIPATSGVSSWVTSPPGSGIAMAKAYM